MVVASASFDWRINYLCFILLAARQCVDKNEMKTKSIVFTSVVIFFVALFVVPVGFIPDTNRGGDLVTVITFLFGILAGFYIVVTTTDYNSFKAAVAEETAGWISLYQNMVIYDRRAARRLANLIDQYIIRAFDFEIIEYVRITQHEFQQIDTFIRRLPVKERLSGVHEKISDNFINIVLKRQMLTVLSMRTLSFFQWAVLYILSGLLVLVLYGIRDGRIFSDLVAVSISSSVVLILILVRELDLFLWNEKTFAYDAYQNVFVGIGKLPYYPQNTINNHRVTISEPIYRVGEELGRGTTRQKRRIQIIGLEKKRPTLRRYRMKKKHVVR